MDVLLGEGTSGSTGVVVGRGELGERTVEGDVGDVRSEDPWELPGR